MIIGVWVKPKHFGFHGHGYLVKTQTHFFVCELMFLNKKVTEIPLKEN